MGSRGARTAQSPHAGDTHPLSPDPRFYQEIRERGLNTIHESDDDLLDESSSPEETQKVDARIVVKSYRPPQVTWSQLPEVGPGWRGGALLPTPWVVLPVRGAASWKRPVCAQLAGRSSWCLRAALPCGAPWGWSLRWGEGLGACHLCVCDGRPTGEPLTLPELPAQADL